MEEVFLLSDMERADAMPPSLPLNQQHHIVIAATSKKGKGETHEVNVGEGYASAMSVKDALRELAQNLIDQAAKSNGAEGAPSFNGINITHGTRRDGVEEAFVIHNDRFKLAEVIHDNMPTTNPPQYFASEKKREDKVPYGTLSFINYGPTVLSPSALITIGNTDKKGASNQVGHHGEGLKRAICRLLTIGCGVEIFVPIIDKRPILNGWRFFIMLGGHADGNVCYKTSLPNPRRVHPIAVCPFIDTNHIEIRITYPKEGYINYLGKAVDGLPHGLGFDMFDHLAPRKYFRSVEDANDMGTILFESKLRNQFFVYHFFVFAPDPTDKSKMQARWGYDFFCPITRDRNQLSLDQICSSAASVWSKYLAEHDIHDLFVNEFYDNIVFAKRGYKVYESLILNHLSKAACLKLVTLFQYRHPDTYPVLEENKWRADNNLKQAVFVVPNDSAEIFFGPEAFETFAAYRKRLAVELGSEKTPLAENVPREIQNMFPKVMFKLCPNNKLYFANNKSVFFVNWALFMDTTVEKAASTMLSYLSNCDAYDKTSLVENMLSVFKKSIASPLPLPPPVESSSSTNEEVYVIDDNSNRNAHPKKRERAVVSAPAPAPGSLIRIDRSQLGPAPPGMKYIYTWCLVEDK